MKKSHLAALLIILLLLAPLPTLGDWHPQAPVPLTTDGATGTGTFSASEKEPVPERDAGHLQVPVPLTTDGQPPEPPGDWHLQVPVPLTTQAPVPLATDGATGTDGATRTGTFSASEKEPVPAIAFDPNGGGRSETPAVETGSYVYFPTGSYYFSETDLKVAASAIPMVWERTYRSNRVLSEGGGAYGFSLPAEGPLGYGWHSPWLLSLEGRLVEQPGGEILTVYAFTDADGRIYHFERDAAGGFLPDRDAGLTLERLAFGFELQRHGGHAYRFDTEGRLIAVEDPLGNGATLSYQDGRLTAVHDVRGREVFALGYNAEGHIDRVTDLAGRSVDYEYDAYGNLTGVRQGGGELAGYVYNGYHGLMQKTNAVGETYRIDYQYPSRGIAGRVIDPIGTARFRQGLPLSGHVLTLRYEFERRLFWVTGYDGATRKYELNEAGKIVAEYDVDGGVETAKETVEYLPDGTEKTTDAAGGVTLVMRDAWGNVTRRVDGEGNETLTTYNAAGRPLSVTDPLGVTTRFSYDASGTLPVSIERASGRPEAVTTGYGYSAYGDLESTTVAGATTGMSYNAAGLPLTVTDPLGNVSRFEYDAVGNLTAAVDAEGNRSVFGYDARRNLLAATDPLGGKTLYSYNAAGRLLQVTDPMGRTTRTESDFKGRVTAVVDALGQRREFGYDGKGNLTRIVDGEAVTRMAYDRDSRLTAVTDPEGYVTRYEYAEAGCSSCGGGSDLPKRITDPLGNVTENLFDNNGRVVGVKDPLQHLTALELDGAGRVVARTDAAGKVTRYRYDGLGRVIGQVDAAGGETAFAYDGRGNLLSLTDPKGQTTTFGYDLAGRKTSETRPLGQLTRYAYYKNGLLQSVTDPKEQTTTYQFDSAGRMVQAGYADGTEDTFAFDAAGNLRSWTGADGVSGSMAYDALNRKTAESVDYGAFSKNFAYSYDRYGNKETYTSPEGIEHRYEYDLAGRLTAIEFDGKTVALERDWNRLTAMTLPGGVSSEFGYNAAGWLTGIAASGPQGTVMSRDYGFDPVGNILSKASDHGGYGYGYDDLYQLTSADNPEVEGLADEGFSYDAVGNRQATLDTTGEWQHDANNALTGYDDVTFGYDANGNTVTMTGTQGTGTGTVPVPLTTTYVYNARNRLSKVELPDGTVAEYRYDPFGRRVQKTVTGTMGTGTAGAEPVPGPVPQTTFFAYADEGLVGEYDAGGMMRKVYGWKPDGLWGTDPLYMVEGGDYYFYHNDHLGTPQVLTAAGDGSVVWQGVHLAFGGCVVDAASTVENNLRFPGQYADGETGLYYNFQRYYDPVRGRYTQVDPIGFAGGDLNLYGYVWNRPGYLIDQLGLDPYRQGAWGEAEPVTRCHVNPHNDPKENAIGGILIASPLVAMVAPEAIAVYEGSVSILNAKFMTVAVSIDIWKHELMRIYPRLKSAFGIIDYYYGVDCKNKSTLELSWKRVFSLVEKHGDYPSLKSKQKEILEGVEKYRELARVNTVDPKWNNVAMRHH